MRVVIATFLLLPFLHIQVPTSRDLLPFAAKCWRNWLLLPLFKKILTLTVMAGILLTFVIGSVCVCVCVGECLSESVLFAHTRGSGLCGVFSCVQLLGNCLYALEFPSAGGNRSVQPTHPTSPLSSRTTALLFPPPASQALSHLHSAHSLIPRFTCWCFTHFMC